MLVNATEMLIKARDGHYGVPQFNINNLEWTKSVLTACEEMKSPVILGVSEGAGKYMTGFKTVAAMVSAMVDSMGITVPVALHLDHGSYDAALQAMEDGFSSVMFDGSHYGIEENIEKTKEIIRIANEKGISVEAEVGAIGGEEDGVIGGGEVADPAECKRIADLGVDMLAAEVVLKMRKEHPEVSLTCVLPCRDQANRWQEADRLRHQDILLRADEVVCLQESYSRSVMLARDRYLVQHSDCLLAVFNGSPGGTKYTVDYALRAGRRVVRIDPQTFERTEDLGQLRLPL